jgi:hypothetical protein
MTRHRTLAAFTLAAVIGAALAMLVGPLTTEPPGPVGSQEPRSVQLPSGRVVPVQAVATGRSGQLDVPDDPRTAGWWRGGSRVGDPSGKTLLAAHVDSLRQGLGPYAELYDVRPGRRLVLRSAGLRQDFRVRSVRLIPRESLTARPELYSPDGVRRLVLITCAPPYDPAHGGYRNLVVLVAAPSGPPTPRDDQASSS